MGLRMVVDGAHRLAPGVWNLRLMPTEIHRLGGTRSSLGSRSVLLIESPTYDEQSREFCFDAGNVRVLNLGTSSDTVVIAASEDTLAIPDNSAAIAEPQEEPAYGTGDREFLRLVDGRLSGPACEAAKELLRRVRREEAGDLERGKRLNFKNTPDNFWYVIVQPTVQALSVTVRGEPRNFEPSPLALKSDRPGYTRFKVDHPDQVEDALRIVWRSRRRDR